MDVESDYSDDNFTLHDSESDEDFVPKVQKSKKKTKTAAATTTTKGKVKSKQANIKDMLNKRTTKKKESNDSSMEDSSTDTVTVTESEQNESYPIIQRQTNKSVTEIYQKKTQLEHILLRPDTYIGSVESISSPMWVFNKEEKIFEYRTVNIVPGLYKIFDEILVNAADNKIRDPTMDVIKVTIDKENNLISVFNNGKGIPVEIHEKEKVYIPELIFGHLLTSSNYDDNEKKVTGGRNGYGAKLCNIFSTEFIIETSDKNVGKKFKQVFNDNMSKKSKPKLTNATKDDFTKITFKPDLQKFGMTAMDDDLEALLLKRVYDIAGCVSGVKVYLNDEKIKIKNFKEYVQMYLTSTKKKRENSNSNDDMDISGSSLIQPIVYERVNERWEIAFSISDGQFQQVSFVNSICTVKGGTHVNYIADQISSKLIETIKKKNKGINIKPFQAKNYLWVFINSLIENPAFDSQTKETLTLRVGSFGSKCNVGDNFINKVIKSGVVDNILTWAKLKQSQMLKKTDGHKRSRITGIPKLDDANNAGTHHSKDCVLILTEGDSAKALAVSGLSVVGRDNYGVFPLRGKMLNVRDASHKSIMDNAEVNAIKQILGLQHGKVYENTDSLRYGHIMIMTDQDTDGSHIKGLVINFLDHFWPSLLKIPGFLLEFITPIVKVTKKKNEISFYTLPEYEQWKEENNNGKGWNIKYYKGLGTSTSADAKKYFSAMEHHCKKFMEIIPDDRKLLEMAFAKKNADKRKDWLKEFTPDIYMDNSVEKISINEFINKELIQFSMADVVRSIPSLVDGFKPGQRKIMYGCFKRNLVNEIKVAQLSGYIAEHSAYHHGEQSLATTILNLAQDFVGSNNISLLVPNGQFGTRLQGGKDAASSRYIFTQLAKITRMIYHKADDNILEYLNDDGQMIEPKWYIPILPMVLVNGAEGIGTGWSTNIPNFNPRDIVMNLKRKLSGLDFMPMHPWYRGFKGTIEKIDDTKYKVNGIIKKIDDTTIEITELPIRVWTQNCKELLESYMVGNEKQPAIIKDYKEYHTDRSVHFRIMVSEANMKKLEAEGIEKKFKTTNVINLTNMHLFDANGRIRKYNNIEQIMEEFYVLRKEMYRKRKDWLEKELSDELVVMENKVRFITEIINGELVLSKKKKAILMEELQSKGYKKIYPKKKNQDEQQLQAEKDDEDENSKGYDYLLTMQLYNLTLEKVEKIQAEFNNKKEELETLRSQTIEDLWQIDLDNFLDEWENLEHEFDNYPTTTFGTKAKNGKAGKVRKTRKKKTKVKIDSESEEMTNASSSNMANRSSENSDDDYNDDDDFVPLKNVKIEKTKRPVTRAKRTVQTKLEFENANSGKSDSDMSTSKSTLFSSSASSLNTLNNELETIKIESSESSISSRIKEKEPRKKMIRKLKRPKIEEIDDSSSNSTNQEILSNKDDDITDMSSSTTKIKKEVKSIIDDDTNNDSDVVITELLKDSTLSNKSKDNSKSPKMTKTNWLNPVSVNALTPKLKEIQKNKDKLEMEKEIIENKNTKTQKSMRKKRKRKDNSDEEIIDDYSDNDNEVSNTSSKANDIMDLDSNSGILENTSTPRITRLRSSRRSNKQPKYNFDSDNEISDEDENESDDDSYENNDNDDDYENSPISKRMSTRKTSTSTRNTNRKDNNKTKKENKNIVPSSSSVIVSIISDKVSNSNKNESEEKKEDDTDDEITISQSLKRKSQINSRSNVKKNRKETKKRNNIEQEEIDEITIATTESTDNLSNTTSSTSATSTITTKNNKSKEEKNKKNENTKSSSPSVRRTRSLRSSSRSKTLKENKDNDNDNKKITSIENDDSDSDYNENDTKSISSTAAATLVASENENDNDNDNDNKNENEKKENDNKNEGVETKTRVSRIRTRSQRGNNNSKKSTSNNNKSQVEDDNDDFVDDKDDDKEENVKVLVSKRMNTRSRQNSQNDIKDTSASVKTSSNDNNNQTKKTTSRKSSTTKPISKIASSLSERAKSSLSNTIVEAMSTRKKPQPKSKKINYIEISDDE